MLLWNYKSYLWVWVIEKYQLYRGSILEGNQPILIKVLSSKGPQLTDHTKLFPIAIQLSRTLSELEVLKLIAKGSSNQEIGAELGVVVGTVKNHIKNIFSKLEVNNRVKAVSLAKELKLLNKGLGD
jgi:ATP/maltotriose-dependent transcriptional regulator MalT